jgi:hypothetical protein
MRSSFLYFFECILFAAACDESVIDEFAAQRRFIVIVFIIQEMHDSISALMIALRPQFAVFDELYDPSDLMTEMLGIQESQLPQFYLVDPNTTRHSLINVNGTAELQECMDDFEIGKIKWD